MRVDCIAQNDSEQLQLLWENCAQKVTKRNDIHPLVTAL
jgi:hypothetical protein